MAQMALVSLYDKSALGVRSLSAYARRAGHTVSVIWMKENENITEEERNPADDPIEDLCFGLTSRGRAYYAYPRPITPEEIRLLVNLLEDLSPDVIGFSLTSMYRRTAAMLTARVRERLPGIPIIWGGIGPTVEPEECIRDADMICLGEGEETVVQLLECLAAGGDPSSIQNLWVRRGSEVRKNPPRPLQQDLDLYPFPDMEPDDKYAISRNTLNRRDPSISNYGDVYDIMTARGCPYHCSFCCEEILQNLYHGQRFLRRRSPENVLEELRRAKKRWNPWRVNFWDEIFVLEEKWLREFTSRYAEQIGIPYWCYVHPNTCRESMLRLLKESGVLEVRMGVQSGSERVNRDVFNRPTQNEDIVRACERVRKMEIPYSIDLISDNPFETEEDRRETLELLLRLPQPMIIGSDTVGLLSFYPNYPITKRLEEEGVDPAVDERTYLFYDNLYLLAQYRPPEMVRKLSKSRFFRNHPALLRHLFPHSRLLSSVRRFIPEGVRHGLKRILRPVAVRDR
jgi:radical SAM superfamily enzyme YgiQ (UPF0313 family)